MPFLNLPRLLLIAYWCVAQVDFTPEEILGPDTAPHPSAEPAATAPDTPIAVEGEVSDAQLRQTIQELLLKYPGVVTAEVAVQNGVVELEGHVRTADTRDRVTQFVRRVQGVRLVLNRMRTDEQVLSSLEFFGQRLWEYGWLVRRYWLRALGGVLIFLASIVLAKGVGRILTALLPHVVERDLIRSLTKSVVAAIILVAGLLIALAFTGLTELFLSVAGVAGIIGLTVGFAFRDIGENFMASVFLGLRRPFQVGDVIEVAGSIGVVRSMNMRATVLMTFEGSYIRIPNSIVFKQVLINRTSGGKIRTDFSVLVPFDAPTKRLMDGLCDAMRGHGLVSEDPPARVFIEDISPEGVRMHGYFWHSAELNPILLRGEVLLRVKVAMQKMDIVPPPPEFKVYVPEIVSGKGKRPPPAGEPGKPAPVAEEDETKTRELAQTAPRGAETNLVAAGVPVEETKVEEGENLLDKNG